VLWTAVPGDLGDKVPRPPPPQGPPRGPLGGKNASCPERLPQPALAPVRGSAASPQAVRPGGLRRPRPERVSPSPSLEPLARPPPPSPPPVKRSFARPRVRSPGTLEGPAVLRLSGPAVPLLPAEPSPVPRSAGPRVGEGTVWVGSGTPADHGQWQRRRGFVLERGGAGVRRRGHPGERGPNSWEDRAPVGG
jgi:hypothetical protein